MLVGERVWDVISSKRVNTGDWRQLSGSVAEDGRIGSRKSLCTTVAQGFAVTLHRISVPAANTQGRHPWAGSSELDEEGRQQPRRIWASGSIGLGCRCDENDGWHVQVALDRRSDCQKGGEKREWTAIAVTSLDTRGRHAAGWASAGDGAPIPALGEPPARYRVLQTSAECHTIGAVLVITYQNQLLTPNLVVSWPGTPKAGPRSQLESNIGASTPNGYGSIPVKSEDHVKAMAVNCPKETGGGNPCNDSSKSHGGRLDIQ
ncbi:hypothetical protein RIB2604_00608160 [Aspergillus luchuensis]|uniref:Uncharacterized protein n=1 Tax=Aspergillus kawachii TaxID=1069201 RepID=A0A146F232_ASPKA|nr:hypothetical protein RIB2604_00608160 [Aspergillus luchuensis]